MTTAQLQIEAIAELLRRVLGSDVVGAYLHGSTATGVLRPHSDTDVLALSVRPTTRTEKRSMIQR